MRLNSRLFYSAAFFVVLSSCDDGSPNKPTPACSFTLATTTLAFPAAGGQAGVGISTTNQCAWVASSDRDWLTINSGAAGTGPGVVNVTVATNPGTTVRSGALTVAGQAVAVTQAAQAACAITLTPASAALSKEAGAGSFSVTTQAHCQWMAASVVGWLTVTSGAAGQGNGTVTFSVPRNAGSTSRTGAIFVEEKSFVVTQEGEVVVSCDYTVTPVEFTPCMSAPFTMTATVTTQDTCTWTAEPNAPWITLTEGQSGTGPGLVSFRVSENWDAPRQGIVGVRWPTVTAGQNLLIRQAGCLYGVSTSSIQLPGAGGEGHFEVVQQSEPVSCGGPLQNACRWSAVADVLWISVTTSMPQVGDNRVTFRVEPNTTGASRTGRIVVRDRTVTITQSGI